MSKLATLGQLVDWGVESWAQIIGFRGLSSAREEPTLNANHRRPCSMVRENIYSIASAILLLFLLPLWPWAGNLYYLLLCFLLALTSIIGENKIKCAISQRFYYLCCDFFFNLTVQRSKMMPQIFNNTCPIGCVSPIPVVGQEVSLPLNIYNLNLDLLPYWTYNSPWPWSTHLFSS